MSRSVQDAWEREREERERKLRIINTIGFTLSTSTTPASASLPPKRVEFSTGGMEGPKGAQGSPLTRNDKELGTAPPETAREKNPANKGTLLRVHH